LRRTAGIPLLERLARIESIAYASPRRSRENALKSLLKALRVLT
jgi:hypothetical protein